MILLINTNRNGLRKLTNCSSEINSGLREARSIITDYRGPKLRIMEVCGTHTHEIFRLGIRQLLPENIELISGPGCPVCVTQTDFIDEAVWLAVQKKVTICTFGDLVRYRAPPRTSAKLGPPVPRFRLFIRRWMP